MKQDASRQNDTKAHSNFFIDRSLHEQGLGIFFCGLKTTKSNGNEFDKNTCSTRKNKLDSTKKL